MFALKIFKGTPTPMCATEVWWNFSTCKNFKSQHPLGAEIWSVEKGDLGGSKLTCTTLWIVDQSSPTCLAERGRNRSRSHVFPIFDILSRSGDIRDHCRKLCRTGPNFACLLPTKFFRGGPPEFLDLDYLFRVDSDHVVKFRGDWPRELRDPMAD